MSEETKEEAATKYKSAKKEEPPLSAIQMVHEFLLKNGYFRSLDSFQEEITSNKSNMEQYLKTTESAHQFGQSFLLDVPPLRLHYIEL